MLSRLKNSGWLKSGSPEENHIPAFLVHGIASRLAWWDPLLPTLRAAGLHPVPVPLPALDRRGPDRWRDTVLRAVERRRSAVLIGHSLGAAVCIETAQSYPAAALVLLACPPFLSDFKPGPPPASHVPAEIIATSDVFLRRACGRISTRAAHTVHLVGARDRWCPAAQAQRLPYPVEVIPDAGHGLNRSQAASQFLARWFKTHLKS